MLPRLFSFSLVRSFFVRSFVRLFVRLLHLEMITREKNENKTRTERGKIDALVKWKLRSISVLIRSRKPWPVLIAPLNDVFFSIWGGKKRNRTGKRTRLNRHCYTWFRGSFARSSLRSFVLRSVLPQCFHEVNHKIWQCVVINISTDFVGLLFDHNVLG